MKKMQLVMILLLGAFITSAYVYQKQQDYRETEYLPILMTRDVMESSISYQSPRTLKNPGKIYFKDHYIFINEKYAGIHVINNKNPKNPQNIGFINVPGSIDMAVKGYTIYVDNAVDLVSINLYEFPDIEVTHRNKEVFPELVPPDNTYVPYEFTNDSRMANTIIVGWEKRKTKINE